MVRMFGKAASAIALALGIINLQYVAAQDRTYVSALVPIELPREGWVVLADSHQANYGEEANAIDGNTGTIWHTGYNPDVAMPHWIAIDMGVPYLVSGYSYTPRQDGSTNGNVGQHQIQYSMDGQTWQTIVQGTWANDQTVKTTLFTPIIARYMSLYITSSANGAAYASAAELNILTNPHAALPRTAWTVSADSSETSTAQSWAPWYAIDNSPTTYWHTAWINGNAPLPHYYNIDTGANTNVGGLSYTPRPASSGPNGRIGQFQVQSSGDGNTWTTRATGTWADTQTIKKVEFTPVTARYWRLVALSEAGNRGPFSSASDINLLDGSNSLANWIITVDSQETAAFNSSAVNALDSNLNSLWHTEYSQRQPAYPHYFLIDMRAQLPVKALQYTPRQDGNLNGNIGNYRIEVSTDGNTYTTVSSGQFADNAQAKLVQFQEQVVRYVRLTALSEAGNRGPWASAAEILLQYDATYAAPNPKNLGRWGLTVDFPAVPVAAALTVNNGGVIVWSSWNEAGFQGASGGKTVTALYDPTTGGVSKAVVTNTQHDMFCPGVSMDFDGRIVVAGGNDASRTSIYVPGSQQWLYASNMNVPRGYQSQAVLSNGQHFTIGGSWSGGIFQKNGEKYDGASNTWTMLNDADVTPMLTNDYQGTYRADNHAWLFAWKNAAVFQAGPSKKMNWYYTDKTGWVVSVGNRGNAPDQMCGTAVLFDAVAGKILVAGGSVDYSGSAATQNSYVLTINDFAAPTVQQAPNMAFKRIFHNSIVLPNGQVFVAGGQDFGSPFNDDSSVMSPELYTPSSNTWATMAPMSVPRNYHSIGLLMIDATVMIGGGGLCDGCDYNHYDGQIWQPPYLFTSAGALAVRPVINSATGTLRVGQTITATTNGAVTAWSMIRMGSATHTVNTDQRRIPLTATANGNTYTMTIPGDAGVALPGYWMLFAMNSAGVPSVAKIVKVTL